jgi:RNA recognition motif-containing protein
MFEYSTARLFAADQLRELFGRYGTVVDAKVMIDRNTGQSRLIGFVRCVK